MCGLPPAAASSGTEGGRSHVPCLPQCLLWGQITTPTLNNNIKQQEGTLKTILHNTLRVWLLIYFESVFAPVFEHSACFSCNTLKQNCWDSESSLPGDVQQDTGGIEGLPGPPCDTEKDQAGLKVRQAEIAQGHWIKRTEVDPQSPLFVFREQTFWREMPTREGWGLDKEQGQMTFLEILWLRLCTPRAGGLGSILGQGTRTHIQQVKNPVYCN